MQFSIQSIQVSAFTDESIHVGVKVEVSFHLASVEYSVYDISPGVTVHYRDRQIHFEALFFFYDQVVIMYYYSTNFHALGSCAFVCATAAIVKFTY